MLVLRTRNSGPHAYVGRISLTEVCSCFQTSLYKIRVGLDKMSLRNLCDDIFPWSSVKFRDRILERDLSMKEVYDLNSRSTDKF